RSISSRRMSAENAFMRSGSFSVRVTMPSLRSREVSVAIVLHLSDGTDPGCLQCVGATEDDHRLVRQFTAIALGNRQVDVGDLTLAGHAHDLLRRLDHCKESVHARMHA